MPSYRLKRGVKLARYNAKATFSDDELVYDALIQSLRDGDAQAFKEILAAYLRVTNKEKFSARSNIPKRTLFRILSPKGNPTLESIAKIVHALAKAA